MKLIKKPYVLLVAEKIYLEISRIRKNNPDFSNINAIENFIGSKIYNEISDGTFHENLFEKFKIDNFIDKESKKKIPRETIELLKIQKEMVIKQLIQFPNLHYSENYFPLEISKRAFNNLWRMCESYELWCKETKQSDLIFLHITD